MEVATEALVLRRYDFSESSQIAHLLGGAEGRVSVLAKGAKKATLALKGPIDAFHLARVRYRRRRGDLDLLVGYEPITGFPGLRSRLDRLYAGFHLLELAHALCRDLDPQPALFAAMVQALAALEDAGGAGVPAVLAAGELAVLDAAGFALSTASCAACGAAQPAGPAVHASSLRGLVCVACAPRSAGRRRLAAGTRALVTALQEAGPRGALRLRATVAQSAELRGLLRDQETWILDRPLATERFVGDWRTGFLPHARRPLTRSTGPRILPATEG